MLQTPYKTVRSWKACFDGVFDVSPFLQYLLCTEANIGHDPDFESTVIKMQDRHENGLTFAGKKAVNHFLISMVAEDDTTNINCGSIWNDAPSVSKQILVYVHHNISILCFSSVFLVFLGFFSIYGHVLLILKKDTSCESWGTINFVYEHGLLWYRWC